MRRLSVLLFVLATACTGSAGKDASEDDDDDGGSEAEGDDTAGQDDDTSEDGNAVQSADYLPLDGARTWSYAQCWPGDGDCSPDADFDRLDVELERVGAGEAILHYRSGEGELIQRIGWRSTPEDGVQITGFAIGDAEWTTTGTPIQVLAPMTSPGEAVSTTTDGLTVQSTFVGIESTTNHWSNDAWESVLVRIDGVYLFSGDWYLSQSYGTAAVHFVRDGAPWVLTNATFEFDE